jgi:hypothetical protein
MLFSNDHDVITIQAPIVLLFVTYLATSLQPDHSRYWYSDFSNRPAINTEASTGDQRPHQAPLITHRGAEEQTARDVALKEGK